jgi:GNAT superfamily N-acetyltransferase
MSAFQEDIDSYFSIYLCYPICKAKLGQVVPVSCERRLQPEIGWGYTVAIWVHITRGKAIISLKPSLFKNLNALFIKQPEPRQLYTLKWRKKIGSLIGSNDTGQLVHVLYCRPEKCRLFQIPECRRLLESDIEAYVKMKLNLYPSCEPDCLVRDIQRNILDGIAFAVFQKGKLVSVSEAPAIGHMQNLVEEVGVDILPEYQGWGYGKAVISAMTKAILHIGRVPLYRCNSRNEASMRLAKEVGYENHSDIIQFREPDKS